MLQREISTYSVTERCDVLEKKNSRLHIVINLYFVRGADVLS